MAGRVRDAAHGPRAAFGAGTGIMRGCVAATADPFNDRHGRQDGARRCVGAEFDEKGPKVFQQIAARGPEVTGVARDFRESFLLSAPWTVLQQIAAERRKGLAAPHTGGRDRRRVFAEPDRRRFCSNLQQGSK